MPIHVLLENFEQCKREWSRVEDVLAEGCQLSVERACVEGAQEALSTRRWKDRTGEAAKRTRGYIELKARGGAVGVIECKVPYASFLDSGTKPHDIYPKEGKGFVGPLPAGQSRRDRGDVGTHRVALRWYDAGGEAHFARVVHHKGTTGDGFFARAYQKAERVIVREIEQAVLRGQRILDQ